MFLSIIISFAVLLSGASATSSDDTCTKPPDHGICTAMFLSWYYDPAEQECKQFVYGGCGGNENRFQSEAACYQHCYEKLIQLFPPQNVSVGFTEPERVFIFWYPPENFKLHDPENGTSTNESDAETADRSRTDGINGASHVDTTTVKIATSTNISSNQSSDHNTTASQTNTTNSADVTQDSTNSSVQSAAGGVDLKLEDFIGKEVVPFHLAVLLNYIIIVKLPSGTVVKNITVANNETEQDIFGLQPTTSYEITVSAVYLTSTVMSAEPLPVTTRQSSKCYCDPYGTSDGFKECTHSLTEVPWCKCKPGHAGLFCEICAHGFYRLAPSMPCHACPCPKAFSTGTCRFVEGYLHCTLCNEGYTGNLCHRCANGYHRDHANMPSKCIKCEGCHNADPGVICDPFTGKCGSCHYNTTGDRCDRCLDGFQGNPLKNIPCVPAVVAPHEGFKPPASGMIAAIVVGTIVLLSGLVGFIVYKRMHNFPKNRPFWTIEFKEDHDDVNFSAVPDDELDHHDFHESQSKKKTKHPPYAQLKEEI